MTQRRPGQSTQRRVVAACGLVLLAGWCPAAAQTIGRQVPLSLEDAVKRAIAANVRVVEADARAEAGRAGADARRAATLPQLTAQAGYTRTNHVDEFGIPGPGNQLRVIYPDIPDNYRTRLDAQWPIYTAGRLQRAEQAARTEAGALSRDADAARAAVTLETTIAYWTLSIAVESVQVVAESLARTDAHLTDVRNQLAAGLVPPGEVTSAQAQAARQRMLLVQARTRQEVAAADLARLVAAEPDATFTLTTALVPPVEAREPLERLARAAREQRPERAALLGRIAAAEQRQAAADAGSKPTVGLNGGVDYGRPNPRIFPREGAWRESWDASIAVSWSLFDGGRTKADVAEAAVAAKVARARLSDFDTALATEIRQRQAELDAGAASIAAADEMLTAATEARRVVGERFRAGVATNTEVLDAQVFLLQAGLDRLSAVAAARIARARLDRVLGR